MEQLTLKQAIHKFTGHIGIEPNRTIAEAFFKEGAEWQKEQYKPLIEEVQITIRYMESIGANEYAEDLKNKMPQ